MQCIQMGLVDMQSKHHALLSFVHMVFHGVQPSLLECLLKRGTDCRKDVVCGLRQTQTCSRHCSSVVEVATKPRQFTKRRAGEQLNPRMSAPVQLTMVVTEQLASWQLCTRPVPKFTWDIVSHADQSLLPQVAQCNMMSCHRGQVIEPEL